MSQSDEHTLVAMSAVAAGALHRIMQSSRAVSGPLAPRGLGSTAFLLCDVQERFRDRIASFDSVVRSAVTLGKVAGELRIPYLATEQYPKALLPTVAELAPFCTPENTFPKMQFSM